MMDIDTMLDKLLGMELQKTVSLSIHKLHPFEGHPYKVQDDADMDDLTESIRTQGILTPLIVRQLPNDEYEVISGHRRLHACKKAGIETVPALITDMDRDAAAIALVDSNRNGSCLNYGYGSGCCGDCLSGQQSPPGTYLAQ